MPTSAAGRCDSLFRLAKGSAAVLSFTIDRLEMTEHKEEAASEQGEEDEGVNAAEEKRGLLTHRDQGMCLSRVY